MENRHTNGNYIARRVRGLCDFPGKTIEEATVNTYRYVGEWIKENAEMLAADSHEEAQAVPIVLEIKIDNAITTIEKKTKYYLTEGKE